MKKTDRMPYQKSASAHGLFSIILAQLTKFKSHEQDIPVVTASECKL